MALPSASNPISIKDIYNETKTDDYTDGNTPSSGEVGIGYGSLAELSDWAANGQSGGGLAAWSTYNGDGSAPHGMGEFHSGNRGSNAGGGPPKQP